MHRHFAYRALGLFGLMVAMAAGGGSASGAAVQSVGAINVGQPLTRIVADPVRGKVYGFADNGDVVFMDRSTLSVTQTIHTGRALTDIDVASDGSFMTVLDNVTRSYWGQPPAVYVLKYNLNTQAQSGISFVQSPLYTMALGRSDRYVGVGLNQWVNVYQANASTGSQLSTAGGGYNGSMDSANVTLLSNSTGTRMYRTETGISSIDLLAFDTSTDTITGIGGRGVGSYSTVPLFLNSSDSSLYVGNTRVDPNNISQTLGVFPENIYAATADDSLAFGQNNVYDPTWGNIIQPMPFHSTQLTIGDNGHYLYAWDGANNRVQVMSIPEPGTVSLLGAGALLLAGRRRRRRA